MTGSTRERLVGHYGGQGLLDAIVGALGESGRSLATATVDDLAPVDEFHVGGRPATQRLIDQLQFEPGAHVLDLGCGIGGTARLLASGSAGRVAGIDLTPSYVATGQALNRELGLAERIDLHVGSAVDLPFDDGSFDAAVMLHVGMNIEDKGRLMAEVGRVLRPGGRFGLYDLMRVGSGQLRYPVPWSSSAETSRVDELARYREAAAAAGFEVVDEHDRTAEATAFFDRLRAAARSGAVSPLGLHLLMGSEAQTKVANMIWAVTEGIIAPTELILAQPRRRGPETKRASPWVDQREARQTWSG